MIKNLKIIFAGTPEFSVPTLISLNNQELEVSHVLTQPDRPSGRGMKDSYSPVKKIALSLNIPILQPQTLKGDDIYEILQSCNADILVVVAYGLIIPERILALFPMGCYNVHASLLPRWRGAAPIHRAIENGDRETGVTIMSVVKKLDAGPMIISEKINLNGNITAGEATNKLANIGGELMSRLILRIQKKLAVQMIEQDERHVTYAEKISKAEAKLEVNDSAEIILRKIRAFNPYPGVSIIYRSKILKIWKAVKFELNDSIEGMNVGGLYSFNGDLILKLVNGAINIMELQPEGKNKMDASSFIRGYELTRIEPIN